MTANDTNRVGSDNSDFRTAEDTEIISEHDEQDRRIVEGTRAIRGTTTRRDLLSKTDLTLDGLENRLCTLADGGYVDPIGESECELVVLTCRSEQVAGGFR